MLSWHAWGVRDDPLDRLVYEVPGQLRERHVPEVGERGGHTGGHRGAGIAVAGEVARARIPAGGRFPGWLMLCPHSPYMAPIVPGNAEDGPALSQGGAVALSRLGSGVPRLGEDEGVPVGGVICRSFPGGWVSPFLL